jgi:imidazolonepropionase
MTAQAPSFVVFAGRVVTCDPARARAGDALGVVASGGIVVERGRIAMVGDRATVAARGAGLPVLADAADAVITPGLCDAHTHAAWVGSRHDEYTRRLQGASYQDIARAGGGIVASMRAVQAATEDEIAATLRARLARMAALGVTTVEVKSGYGLELDGEAKQLRAIAQAARDPALPRVIATYLALHALPPGEPSRSEYAARAASQVGAFAREGLMQYVDAYVDNNAFSVAEARLVAAAAQAAGLGIRLHVGQFADVGAARAAAELGAKSADHLEHVSSEDLEEMARAGTRAVLLPVASLTLAQEPPPVAAMRAAGVALVVASDANPGTAPTESLPLALALAVRSYGLLPDEALLAVTREAAASLGLEAQCGSLAPGFAADLVLWDLPHEHALLQPWGTPRTRLVLREGTPITP